MIYCNFVFYERRPLASIRETFVCKADCSNFTDFQLLSIKMSFLFTITPGVKNKKNKKQK